jgi:class 3 adenylate cyclase
MLQRRGRVTYRALKLQFSLDDDHLEALKDELLYAHPHAVEDDGRGLVWTGEARPTPMPGSPPATDQERAPLSYTPAHLTEKILDARHRLEGERKQVTVLFADTKGSTELIRDLDPEAAQRLLDPAIYRMMEAVHHYEGTVNQVLGDGIMALFGAPIAHEDHALRACYAALAIQAALRDYTEEIRLTHGLEVRIRVGLNSGEVVVRTVGNDLHMDYSAVGQTTHLAARMEQLAAPGSIRLTVATLRLVEGLMQVNALGPMPVKGLTEPVEVFELVRASGVRRRLQAAVARGLTHFVGRETELAALQQTAAVLGTELPFPLLQAIAELPEADLHRGLAHLQAAEFLYETRLFPDREYTFKHALTHEVAYGSLLQERRRALHARIVEAIERLSPDRLAHHAVRGEAWGKAVTYLRQAGAKALARSVYREALAFFEQALAALTHLPETRETQEQAIDVRFDLRNALFPLAEFGRIEGYLREAEALARSLDDQRRLGWVSTYMASHHGLTGGDTAQLHTFAQRVEAIGETLGDVPLQVVAQYYLVIACLLSGDYRGTEDLCRELMQLLQGERTHEQYNVAVFPAVLSRANLARALAERGVFDEGDAVGHEAMRIAEMLDHPYSIVWACLGLAYLDSLRGELSQAAHLLERAVVLCREWNIAIWIPLATASLGLWGTCTRGRDASRRALPGCSGA